LSVSAKAFIDDLSSLADIRINY